MSQKFFITGSGTGVGKTLVTTSLAYQLLAKGKRVSALKPVISGYAEGDMQSDTAALLKCQNLPVNKPNIEAISPWRFAAALAPSAAAAREGKGIDFSQLCEFCYVTRVSEITLIEGAGGVMAPLTHEQTMLDWMSAVGYPAILVAGTYLGAVSHALASAEVLRARGIPLQAVVVSESEKGAMSVGETAHMLQPFLPYARYIAALPHVAGEGDLWQHTPDLTQILT